MKNKRLNGRSVDVVGNAKMGINAVTLARNVRCLATPLFAGAALLATSACTMMGGAGADDTPQADANAGDQAGVLRLNTEDEVTPLAGNVVYGRAEAYEDYGVGAIGGGVTVAQSENSAVTLWAEHFQGYGYDDGGDNFIGGSIGTSYRKRVNENSAVGIHGFLDLGTTDDEDDILAQLSAGGDWEKFLNPEINSSIRFGGNVYVPLDDYTDVAEYGELDRAPLLGVDGFVRYERDLSEASLRGHATAGVFDYFGRSQSTNLVGGFGALGLIYSGALPDGFAVAGDLGVRYANGGEGLFNRGDETSPYGMFQLSYSWGGDQTTTQEVVTSKAVEPRRDCVIVREGDIPAYYDCTRPVVAGDAAGGTKTKTGVVRERLPIEAPQVTTKTVRTPGVRPSTPYRNLGFGVPFAPVQRGADFVSLSDPLAGPIQTPTVPDMPSTPTIGDDDDDDGSDDGDDGSDSGDDGSDSGDDGSDSGDDGSDSGDDGSDGGDDGSDGGDDGSDGGDDGSDGGDDGSDGGDDGSDGGDDGSDGGDDGSDGGDDGSDGGDRVVCEPNDRGDGGRRDVIVGDRRPVERFLDRLGIRPERNGGYQPDRRGSDADRGGRGGDGSDGPSREHEYVEREHEYEERVHDGGDRNRDHGDRSRDGGDRDRDGGDRNRGGGDRDRDACRDGRR